MVDGGMAVQSDRRDDELLDCLSLDASLLLLRRATVPLRPSVFFSESPSLEARAEAERVVLRLLWSSCCALDTVLVVVVPRLCGELDHLSSSPLSLCGVVLSEAAMNSTGEGNGG